MEWQHDMKAWEHSPSEWVETDPLAAGESGVLASPVYYVFTQKLK